MMKRTVLLSILCTVFISCASYLHRGDALREKGKYHEALVAYMKSVQAGQDVDVSYDRVGLVLLENYHAPSHQPIDIFRRGIQYAKKIEKYDHLDKLYWHLGLAYYASYSQDHQAIEAFKESIRLKPEFAPVHKDLGLAYYENKQYDQAIEAFKESIRLKPEFAPAYRELGKVYQTKQLDNLALAALREHNRLAVGDPEERYEFSRVQEQIEKLEKKIASKPSSATSKDATPPTITITSHDTSKPMYVAPEMANIIIRGQVKPSIGVTEIKINGKGQGFDTQGNFSAVISLKIGENPITVAVADINNNGTNQSFIIYRPETASLHPINRFTFTSAIPQELIGVDRLIINGYPAQITPIKYGDRSIDFLGDPRSFLREGLNFVDHLSSTLSNYAA